MSAIIAVPPAQTHASEPTSKGRTTPRNIQWLTQLPFWLVHLAALGCLWSGVTWQAVVMLLVTYWVRMFAVTAGYHRYFSHRTFKTSRFFQLVLAFLAETSAQRGILWWAAHHRRHHRLSDQAGDAHSPRMDGFWYAHYLWIYNDNDATDWSNVKDLARYPELRFLNQVWWMPPWLLGIACYAVGGAPGLFFGFFLSTAVLWHCTFTINSLAHVIGKRRFATTDDSRNHWFLAFITMGEGWHNNHHHYMHSTRQGFYGWELDVTYYVLRGLAALGIVWDLREPPARVLDEGRRLDAERSVDVHSPLRVESAVER